MFGTTWTNWLIWKLEGLASSTADDKVDHVMYDFSLVSLRIPGLSLGNQFVLHCNWYA